MIVYLWSLIALNLLLILAGPRMVGRERKPVTAGFVATQSAVSLVAIVFATVALLRGWSA